VLLLLDEAGSARDYNKVFDRILNGLLGMFSLLFEQYNNDKKRYHCFLKGLHRASRNSLTKIFEIGIEADFCTLPVCVYVQSIAELISDHKESIIDDFRAIAVFKTNDGDFWSAYFGTVLSPDITETYSRRKSPIFVNYGGGVIPRRAAKYQGTAVHRIEKPVYEPRVFISLKKNDLIFYNLYTNRRSRKQLRGL
jgi:hypothetical protein